MVRVVTTNRRVQTDFSDDDRSVLERVAEGLTDAEIASQIERPERQVAHSVSRLIQELGAIDRLELTLIALDAASSRKHPKQAQKKPGAGAEGGHNAEEECG